MRRYGAEQRKEARAGGHWPCSWFPRGRLVTSPISVSRAAGDVAVEGKHGDIDLRSLRSDPISVRTKHGNVTVELVELGAEGSVTIGNVRGNIDLALPPSARASIDATVRSGRLSCALPLVERIGERFRLHGVLNAPGATVSLRTTSGDIDLRATPA